MLRKRTLVERISLRIRKSKDAAFIYNDFKDLSDRDQVIRALSVLCKNGELLRMGQGVYAKVDTEAGTQFPMLWRPFPDVAKEALLKRGVQVYPTKDELAYNTGMSTQVPTGLVFGIKKPVSLKLEYRGRAIRYEKV